MTVIPETDKFGETTRSRSRVQTSCIYLSVHASSAATSNQHARLIPPLRLAGEVRGLANNRGTVGGTLGPTSLPGN
jgi:hypothetical protein